MAPPVSKTSSGYNLLHLMIGSEGTLGIITELTLKLIPAPGATISLVVPFADLPTCISTVPKLRHSHLNPQAIEFFEKEILITSETYLKNKSSPGSLRGPTWAPTSSSPLTGIPWRPWSPH